MQQAALDALRRWLTCESVDLTPLLGDGTSCPPEDTDLALLRFLRHNDWDVQSTKTQVRTVAALLPRLLNTWHLVLDIVVMRVTMRQVYVVLRVAIARAAQGPGMVEVVHYARRESRKCCSSC